MYGHIASRESGEEWEFKFPVSSFEFLQFSKVKSSRNSSLISYNLLRTLILLPLFSKQLRVLHAPPFFKLRPSPRLISPRSFDLCQCLIARCVHEHFLFNRGVSHFYTACCMDEQSRISISGYKILTAFGFGLP